MKLLVQDILPQGAEVRELRLRAIDGQTLPAWQPGAHLRLHLQPPEGPALERHYSLLGLPGDRSEYRIAVLRDPASRGGSRWIHEALQVGATLEVEGPFDSFPLQAGNGRTLLIAGGIGVTPLHAMAHALNARGQAFEMHYLARSQDRLALLSELRLLERGALHLHVGARPDLAELLGAYAPGDTLHACGPQPLIDALRARAPELGWPTEALHFESFGARAMAGDQPLEVHLAQSGFSLRVEPGTSLLDALIAADAFVAYDCKRGECGQCHTAVLDGEPLHRDFCLTPDQRAQGMCTCVGWARGPSLTLDL